jgi:hypothetical protein
MCLLVGKVREDMPIKVKSFASAPEPVAVTVRRPSWQQFISY